MWAALRILTPYTVAQVIRPPNRTAAEKQQRAAAERDRRARCAAKEATDLLATCQVGRSEYLARKGLDPPVGMIAPAGSMAPGELVLPLRRDGQVVAVQTISGAGVKKFRPYGCAVRGASFLFGADDADGIRWLVEGWATGQAVLQALAAARRTRDSVRVCFSAAGIAACAGTAEREVVIADHDWFRCQDCGAKWTEAATPAVLRSGQCGVCWGGKVSTPAGARYALATGLPWWQPERPGSDACDLWTQQPRRLSVALRKMVRAALHPGP